VRDISIANIRYLPPPAEWPEWYVYVGRSAPRRGLKRSPLANIYLVGDYSPDLGRRFTRQEVIALYASNVLGQPMPGFERELGRVRTLLAKHGKLILVCWCAPRACHAEVIRDALLAEVEG